MAHSRSQKGQHRLHPGPVCLRRSPTCLRLRTHVMCVGSRRLKEARADVTPPSSSADPAGDPGVPAAGNWKSPLPFLLIHRPPVDGAIELPEREQSQRRRQAAGRARQSLISPEPGGLASLRAASGVHEQQTQKSTCQAKSWRAIDSAARARARARWARGAPGAPDAPGETRRLERRQACWRAGVLSYPRRFGAGAAGVLACEALGARFSSLSDCEDFGEHAGGAGGTGGRAMRGIAADVRGNGGAQRSETGCGLRRAESARHARRAGLWAVHSERDRMTGACQAAACRARARFRQLAPWSERGRAGQRTEHTSTPGPEVRLRWGDGRSSRWRLRRLLRGARTSRSAMSARARSCTAVGARGTSAPACLSPDEAHAAVPAEPAGAATSLRDGCRVPPPACSLIAVLAVCFESTAVPPPAARSASVRQDISTPARPASKPVADG